MDDIVGRVEAALEHSSRPRLIIFASDNGAPTCYPEDGSLEDHLPNGELRGQKADVYDGGHRVPLIVAGDGLAPGTDARLVSLLDLFPSLLEHVAGRVHGDPAGRPGGLPSASLALDGAGDLLHASGSSSRVVGTTAFDGSLVVYARGADGRGLDRLRRVQRARRRPDAHGQRRRAVLRSRIGPSADH